MYPLFGTFLFCLSELLYEKIENKSILYHSSRRIKAQALLVGLKGLGGPKKVIATNFRKYADQEGNWTFRSSIFW